MSFSGTKGYITKPKPGVMLNPLHPLSQGLVGYWLFNEGSGSRAYDISGHGNHGTLKNMSLNAQDSGWGSSKFGGGLEFDGIDDYNRMLGSSTAISLNNFTEQSICVWVKFNGLKDYNGILSKWSHTSLFRQYAIISDSTGKLGYYISADNDSSVSKWSTNNLVNVGRWYYLVFTWTPSAMVIYVDGVIEETFTISIPATLDSTSGIDFVIGCWGNAHVNYSDAIYNLNGSICSSCIYNRALSASEIKQLYCNPFCNLLQVPIRRYSVAAPPVGAIMNQFQTVNLGADLYQGAIIA